MKILSSSLFYMATVGRLKQGDLLLTGEVDERLPAVTSGLVAHFPFDDTEVGKSYRNLLDTSVWKVGVSGSQGMFGQNGDGNIVVMKESPWGVQEPTWASINNDATSDADGGWNVTGRPIDNTKKYRLTIWIRREAWGTGNTYFGCQGSTVHNLSDSLVNSNPYFVAGSFAETYDNWALFVGYVHPSSYALTTSDPTNGLYTLDGTRIRGFTDYKWAPTATSGGHRTYLYYSTTTTERQYFARPRFEICDGNEATISELLKGWDDFLHPATHTNTSVSSKGVGIEEATTNILSSITSVFGAWGGMTGSSVTYKNNQGRNGVYLKALTSGGANWYSSGGQKTSSVSTVYTVSATIRYAGGTPSPNLFYLRQYRADGTQITEGGLYSSSFEIELGEGWKRAYRTFTTHAECVKFLIEGYEYGVREIWMEDIQCEQKSFATSFTESSRGSGLLSIQTDIGLSNFTIYGELTPNADSDTLPNSSYFLDLGNGMILRTYNQVPYIDGNAITGVSSNNVHLDFNTSPGAKVKYIIQRNGTTFTWRMKSDNGQDVTWTKVHANVASKVLSSLNFHGSWGGVHSNLSIYNRALGDDEIKKLLNSSFKINKQGSIVSEINEKQSGTPIGGSFFPLGVNAESIWSLTKPSTEVNTAYKDGAVWVGSTVTNLYRQAISNEDFPARGSGIFTVKNLGEEIEFQYDYSQNLTWTYHGQTAAVVIGTAYRASMDVFISEDANITPAGTTFVANMEGGCSTSFYYDNTKKGTWQHFENVVTATTTSTNLYLYPCTGTTPATTGHVKYKNVMLTPTTFTHPFVNGTRGYSNLSYTGTDLTSNSWQEFTLLFWAKYMTGGMWRLCGAWPRFYFGPDPSNNLSFAWVGLSGAGDATSGQNNVYGGAVPIGKWTMIGVSVRNNAFIDLYVDGVRRLNWVNSFEMNSTGMNFEWNSFTPGDTAYPQNAFIRDAMFLNRTVTPAEVKEMYQTQLRTSKDNSIVIQGQLKEGEVL